MRLVVSLSYRFDDHICDPILENHPFEHMQNFQENSIENFSNFFK